MNPAYGRERERGVTAVVVALVMMALCAFLALVINSGHLMSVRGQLQNATDAAALAGVRELNGTVDGAKAAQIIAADYAQRHVTDAGMKVEIDPDDVEIGYWDFKVALVSRESAFKEASLDPVAIATANAVRVLAGREGANAVSVTMGGLLGKDKADVRANSVAVLGGPTKECLNIPLAFSDCAVRDPPPDGPLRCDQEITFNSDIEDSVGFTNLSADASVDPKDLKEILEGECRDVGYGDPISVGNGADIQPLVNDFLAFKGQKMIVPVVDLPDCRFNARTTTVTGFLTITIDAVCPFKDDPLCTPGDKFIKIKIECGETTEHTTEGGAPYYGTAATLPRLVR